MFPLRITPFTEYQIYIMTNNDSYESESDDASRNSSTAESEEVVVLEIVSEDDGP